MLKVFYFVLLTSISSGKHRRFIWKPKRLREGSVSGGADAAEPLNEVRLHSGSRGFPLFSIGS